MKLYFKNSLGEERLIAECKTVSACHKKIQKFLDENNYVSYYSRSWKEDNRIKIDVGSYSEFFYVDEIIYEDYLKALHKKDMPEHQYRQITIDECLESLQKNRE